MPLSAEEQVKLDALLEKYEYAPHSGSPTHWATKAGFFVVTTKQYVSLPPSLRRSLIEALRRAS